MPDSLLDSGRPSRHDDAADALAHFETTILAAARTVSASSCLSISGGASLREAQQSIMREAERRLFGSFEATPPERMTPVELVRLVRGPVSESAAADALRRWFAANARPRPEAAPRDALPARALDLEAM